MTDPIPLTNVQKEVPCGVMPKKEFDLEWLYKPVVITGIFDHTQEEYVQRTVKGEQGYEIVTPLFTGVNP